MGFLKYLGSRIQPNKNKRLSKEDTEELQELNRILLYKLWEYEQVEKNTVQVTNGQIYLKTLGDVIRVLETGKRRIVGLKLTNLGLSQGEGYSVDLKTGIIYKEERLVEPPLDAVVPPNPKVPLENGNREQRRAQEKAIKKENTQ